MDPEYGIFMARTYNVTAPGLARTVMNGVLLSESPVTARIENLGRADVQRGQTDIWDGFRYPTSYWMQYYHDNRPYGTWRVTRFGRHYEYSMSIGWLANFVNWPHRSLPEVPSDASNQALIKALTQLKDQKVNLAVAMAEAGSVAEMIRANAMRIYEGLRHLKKRRWKRAFRAIRHTPRKGWDRELASRILEFQYGVRPLVADIYGAMEALANAQYGPGRCGKPFKVQGVIRGGSLESAKSWTVDQPGYLPVTGSTREYWEVKTILWFSPKNGLLKTASEMGMLNPVAGAWELLPFSCVYDWAWPVSSWLNTLDAALGLEFRGGTTTVWRQTQSTYSGLKTPNNGTSSLQGSYAERSMNRAVHTSLPYPMPPGVKNPFSMERALNALALLTSAFR